MTCGSAPGLLSFPQMPDTDHRAQPVLILCSDVVAAALLGIFVELARFTPVFPRVDETPEEAVARIRPLAIVFLDGALDAARSDLFFAAAAKARLPLAVFSAPNLRADTTRARARGIPCFDFPTSVAEVGRMLDEARDARWWNRAGERRRSGTGPRVAPDEEGGLVYHDRHGQRWSVYDRRGSADRRAPEDGSSDEATGEATPMERVFVSESGEVRTCPIGAAEAADRRPERLEAQLARAMPAGTQAP
jgi:hypothetical protein